ncbi:hypothetical protein G9464_03615 [Halostella sp. JP-L12]|uniref:hypothetical protein n=1 Tax=Halostella TaxID=1843185 RepID=UPI000EF7CA01|nr:MULTISPECIES: hypothetical protein [Halostella]NHN46683.1 hypothetical protein [Halostella sp. JP-L12]
MARILNSHTETVHKYRGDDHRNRTECGALRHVAEEHVRRVDGDRGDAVAEASRCGRCFDGQGGY